MEKEQQESTANVGTLENDGKPTQPNDSKDDNVKRKKVYRSIFESPLTSEYDTDSSDFPSDRVKSFMKKLKFDFKAKSGSVSDASGNLDDSLQGGQISLDGSICKNTDAENEVISPEEKEEKERFQDIEKELQMLNTAIEKKAGNSSTARLYTGPYGQIRSPFKKFSSFSTFSRGMKRSPIPVRRPLIKKEETSGDDNVEEDDDNCVSDDDSTSGSSNSSSSGDSSSSGSSSSSEVDEEDDATPETTPDKPQEPVQYKLAQDGPEVCESSYESDDDPDQLAIHEEDSPPVDLWEGKLDEELNLKSSHFALTAINVKSIIHKIITNESVVEMVRQAVHEELKESSSEGFEPKMTRSKVKEVLETRGSVPHPWGLSPVKKRAASPTFLDIELPEDEEEDEDFNPDKGDLNVTESDDDTESFLSSNYLSDIGSPSTPGTPRLVSTPGSRVQKKTFITPSSRDCDNSNSLLSPMGPPSNTVVPRSNQLGRKFQDAMERHDMSSQESEEELIAKRTRSKLPLTDKTLMDIEANFVAPDITPDMYDTYCNDDNWQQFLTGLTVSDKIDVLEESIDTVNEDEDPEYNFMEEAEEEYDREDFRDDRAVKVSKRELHELLDELYEYDAFPCDPFDEDCKKSIKVQTDNIVINEKKKKEVKIHQNLVLQIGEWERLQIEDQMRQHVQLLSSTFVMAQTGSEEHKLMADGVKLLLKELNVFADGACNGTMLRPCNLMDAVELVESWGKEQPPDDPSITEVIKTLSFRYENQKLPALTYQQMHTFWTNPIFIYLHLLPHGGFFLKNQLKKDRSRVKFLEAEDNLLAMGLDQFSIFPEALEFIQRFLLPTKTIKQIQIRIKNLKANAAKDNAVKFWKQFKRLPVFNQPSPLVDVSNRQPVKDRITETSELPSWCKLFNPSIKAELSEVKTERQQRRKERVSFSYPLCDLAPASGPRSRPCTPVSDLSDQQMSSESSMESPAGRKPAKRTRRPYRRKTIKQEPSKSGFVPLTTSATTQSSTSNPITIVMVDKLLSPSKPTGLTSVSTPTFVVISNSQLPGTPPTPQPLITSTPILLPTASLPFTSINVSRNIPISMPSLCAPMVGSSQIVFTSIANPSPHQVAVSAASTTSITNLAIQPSSQSDLIADCLRESNIDLGDMISDTSMAAVTPALTVTPLTPSSSVSVSVNPPVVPFVSKSQSSGSSVALTSIGKIGALSSKALTIDKPSSCVCSQSMDTSGSHDSDVTIKPSTPKGDDSMSHNSSKSTAVTPPSSKPALDLVAAYAQYFISPKGSAASQQQLLETTPKKKKGRYAVLAPKPMTESDQKPVDPELFRKVKSSPRRKQLQEKVKTILPKGFVISTFDTSPAKKVASNLVDKAIQKGRHKKGQGYFSASSVQKYRKILPSPLKATSNNPACSQTRNAQEKNTVRNAFSNKGVSSQRSNRQSTSVKECGAGMETEGGMLDDSGEEMEGVKGEEEEEKCVDSLDTESEYTQSEDGNDTQEEEVEEVEDSQEEGTESQEDDDAHIANLMQASTTLSYDPTKEDLGKLRMAKKDRDRDVTLAMLAPDVIQSDPKRDDRDVVFAQAYLHKVKKALREDLETLEKFLGLMYNFSKADENPVKLYSDLRQLFAPYPELMHEFAGFLLKDQAIECGCYESYLEFHQARAFLRKIEIYFRQNPHQCQKVMKTLSRWHKKPGKRLMELREQVEPLLKGQKYLLEEFSRFFPDERPPESLMEDFEEVVLDSSDGEKEGGKNDSFEDIEMMEEEEILGTKRCSCQCHVTGDDTYKKKKKHCYKCCLTVIDGELVYRVNKTTIKKVQVSFGPPVCRTSLESRDGESVNPTQEVTGQGIMEENHMEVDAADTTVEGGTQTTLQLLPDTDTKADTDSTQDTVALSIKVDLGKQSTHTDNQLTVGVPDVSRNIENHAGENTGHTVASPTCVDKTNEPSSSASSLSNDILAAAFSSALFTEVSMDASMLQPSAQIPVGPDTSQSGAQEGQAVVVTKPIPLTTHIFLQHRPLLQHQQHQPLLQHQPILQQQQLHLILPHPAQQQQVSKQQQQSFLLQPFSQQQQHSSSQLPLNLKPYNPQQQQQQQQQQQLLSQQKPVLQQQQVCSQIQQPKQILSQQQLQQPVLQPQPLQQQPAVTGGKAVSSLTGNQESLQISFGSSFSKVSPFKQPTAEESSTDSDKSASTSAIHSSAENQTRDLLPVLCKESSNQSGRESPIFSPFSPFGQEVQALTGMGSPLSMIPSPGAVNQPTSRVVVATKVRRVTPIPVKESDRLCEESNFQTAVVNSPVLFDAASKSPYDQNKATKPVIKIQTDTPKVPDEESKGAKVVGMPSSLLCKPEVEKSDSSKLSLVSGISKESNPESDSAVTDVALTLTRVEPDLFSQNANKEFPNTPAEPVSSLLSEESVFKCLNKPLNFSDTLHSISNLTNILHALDERTLPGHSPSKSSFSARSLDSSAASSKDTSVSDHLSHSPEVANERKLLEPIIEDTSEEGKEDDIGKVVGQDKSAGSCASSTTTESSNNSVDSVDGDKTLEAKTSQYYPTSVQSIENLDRLQQGGFSVSHLSDSDSSCHPTPSSSFVTTSAMICSSKEKLQQATGNEVVFDRSLVKQPLSCEIPNTCEILDSDRKEIKKDKDCSKESTSSHVKSSRKRKHKSKHKSHKESKYQRTEEGRASCETNITDKVKFSTDKKIADSASQEIDLTENAAEGDLAKLSESGKSLESKLSHNPSANVHDKAEGQSTQSETREDIGPSLTQLRTPSVGDAKQEPVWTTETDKMILEGCKKRGIKDRTFAKMARKIGNVTAQQVKNRFGQLYQLIFNQSPF